MIRPWTGKLELLPGVTLAQPGGHFPGSAVVHWAAGAEGRGVLLTGDTVFPNPDRKSISFMRSYPNRIPLSGAVVDQALSARGLAESGRRARLSGSRAIEDRLPLLRCWGVPLRWGSWAADTAVMRTHVEADR